MASARNIFASPRRIRPEYSDAFRCAGTECEDTCCKGWNVWIDKETYTKYQAIESGPFRILMERQITLNPHAANDREYAKMVLSDDTCGFLAPDHLCSIQKDYGESYLSRVCAVYPRVTKNIDFAKETTLTLSCPEAAKLILLDEELVPAKKATGADGDRYRYFLEPAKVRISPLTRPIVFFWQVRQFVVLLLKDRSYPLWQRLFLLGMFCRRMEALTSAQKAAQIPILLREYSGLIASGKLRPAMEGIPTRPALQLGITMKLMEQREQTGRKNLRLLSCLEDFAKGIQYEPGRAVDDLETNYVEAWANWFQPWADENPHVLENYLLNYVFGHLFPFGSAGAEQGMHAHEAYQQLCFHYGLIKGLLIGMAGHYREAFGIGHAVLLIQSFARAVEHSSAHVQQIVSFFADNGLNNTDGIMVLLRDGASTPPAQGV